MSKWPTIETQIILITDIGIQLRNLIDFQIKFFQKRKSILQLIPF